MVRASLAVDAEIADSLSKLAEAKHMTLYSLTNQILQTFVEMMNENIEPQDVKALFRAHVLLRDLDAVVLPSEFMDMLIADLYAVNKEKLLERFRQLGRDVGKVLKVYAASVEELFELAKTVGQFFPLKRLEVRPKQMKQYEIALLGVGSRPESTQCVYESVKAILHEYGYRTRNETVGKGIIKCDIEPV